MAERCLQTMLKCKTTLATLFMLITSKFTIKLLVVKSKLSLKKLVTKLSRSHSIVDEQSDLKKKREVAVANLIEIVDQLK